MSQTTSPISAMPGAVIAPVRSKKVSKSFFASSFARFMHSRLNVVTLVILVIITVISYAAPWIAANILHQDRDTIDFNLLTQGLQPPVSPGQGGHLLGTDELGRDLAVRLIYGGQVSLSVGFLTAAISVVIGTTLGLVSGFFGGWVDDLINFVVQVLQNIPTLFLLLVVSTLFAPNVLSLSLTIGLISWTGGARFIRGAVLSLRNRDYIDAARVTGASNTRLMGVHILPNVISLMLVQVGFDVVGAMLLESGLSFLGFGLSIPIPSWGNMLSNSKDYFTSAVWLVYAPALAFFVTVLCVYLVADGLRDAFDPRLRE